MKPLAIIFTLAYATILMAGAGLILLVILATLTIALGY